MKIFVSSVVRGLEEEREGVTHLLRATEHQVVRFEDFPATDASPRVACLRAIEDVDVYVLLLGQHYGNRMPDSGYSPTEEEFHAAVSLGKPRLVFRKADLEMDPDQADFAREVGAYVDGRFWVEFTGVIDLAAKVLEALRQVRLQPEDPEWRTVDPQPLEALHANSTQGWSQHACVLEVDVVPLGQVTLRATRSHKALTDQVIRRARSTGLVDVGDPLHSIPVKSGIHVQRPSESGGRAFQEVQRNPYCGILVRDSGPITVYQALPSDGLGAVTNESDLTIRIHLLLDQCIPLIPSDVADVVVTASLFDGGRATLGDPSILGNRNSAKLGWPQDGIMLPADRAVSRETLLAAIGLVAAEVAVRLAQALAERR